ncbi:hypothetical protein D3C80_2093200 [compost metagenome]
MQTKQASGRTSKTASSTDAYTFKMPMVRASSRLFSVRSIPYTSISANAFINNLVRLFPMEPRPITNTFIIHHSLKYKIKT